MLQEPSFYKMIDSPFISINKFGSFNNSFKLILNLALGNEHLFC